jgi:peptidoglycan L-alanyl-D-glutamate endopeptidase CwlK
MVDRNTVLLDTVFPDVKERALKVYAEMKTMHGVTMRCTEGVRLIDRQTELYAQGRTKPGPIVTWSEPGNSMHGFFCAFDSCFAGSDPYLEILHKNDPAAAKALWEAFGTACEKYGLAWGGRWSDEKLDRPHAQMTYGHKLSELQQLYKRGGREALFVAFENRLNKLK